MKAQAAKSQFVIGEFLLTGINKLNIDAICKKWNHLWGIYEYNNDYTVVKLLRKNAEAKYFKTAISHEDAMLLIEKMGLTRHKSEFFRTAAVWK